jgi:hypothetical protein
MRLVRHAGQALLIAAAGGALLAGCGGGDDDSTGDLRWARPPQVFRAHSMPRDRVLMGTVRNSSFRPLNLKATDLSVRDRAGHRLPAHVQFIESYAHGLYGAYQRPNPIPQDELIRLGLVVRILPGESAPLTVAYRTRPGLAMPLRVSYRANALSVPRAIRRQPG